MADQEFRLETIISTFENHTRLAEALFFPEIAAYGRNPDKVIRRLHKGVSDVLAKLPLLDVHRRRSAGTPQVRKVTIELQPADDRNWQTPVMLTFHILVWTHSQTASIAYVPSLGIGSQVEGLPSKS